MITNRDIKVSFIAITIFVLSFVLFNQSIKKVEALPGNKTQNAMQGTDTAQLTVEMEQNIIAGVTKSYREAVRESFDELQKELDLLKQGHSNIAANQKLMLETINKDHVSLCFILNTGLKIDTSCLTELAASPL